MNTLASNEKALSPSTDLHVARGYVERADIASDSEPYRVQVLDFVEDNPDALHRTNLRGHLTGSAVVFDAAGDRVVLLHHRKLRRWLQPGGHADGDANLAAVALREATEETAMDGLRVDPVAVDIDVHEVDHDKEGVGHLHLDVRFIVVAPSGADVIGNHESTAIEWVAFADLGDYDLDAGTHRMIEHARLRMATSS